MKFESESFERKYLEYVNKIIARKEENPKLDIKSKKWFYNKWEKASASRKEKTLPGHISIVDRIVYKQEYKTSKSVARKRTSTLTKLFDVNVKQEQLQKMTHKQYLDFLNKEGIDLNSYYTKLKKSMSSSDASHYMSQLFFGSK